MTHWTITLSTKAGGYLERWVETTHTLDGNGSLSAGWPTGYLEP